MQAELLIFIEIFVERQCFKGAEFKCSVVTREAQEQKPSSFQTQNVSTILCSPIHLSMIHLPSICHMLTKCQAVGNEHDDYYSFPLGILVQSHSRGQESPALQCVQSYIRYFLMTTYCFTDCMQHALSNTLSMSI